MTMPEIKTGDPLRLLLADLRCETPRQTIERTNGLYDRLSSPFGHRLVIFGAGQLGQSVLPAIREAGLEALAFCDNNARRWGATVDGVPLMSPAEAVQKHGQEACFLVAVYHSSAPRRQLRELGCPRIVPYPVFFWKHWRHLPAEERLELPHRILEQADAIPAGYALLSDDTSRHEFVTQLRWRCLMDYDCLPTPHPAEDMYFPGELFRLSPEEVVVDCGAFDGDSMQMFLNRSGGRFRHMYLFEPDPSNLSALAARLAAYPPETAARVSTHAYAVGSENGTVRFTADGSAGSRVASGGAIEIECRTLDRALAGGPAPTLIKMDIEGAEVQAIPGAAEIIRRHRPILAVCAYHRCEHLWIIPQLLKQADPGYEIFLRRYAEECWETVYYAVPPERLVR